MAKRKYELADFDPVDGHVHSCHVPGQVAANNELVEPCDCAGFLFAIAQDEALRTEQVGWVKDDGDEYHDFRYASHVDRAPGVADSIAREGYLPVFVRTQGPSDG